MNTFKTIFIYLFINCLFPLMSSNLSDFPLHLRRQKPLDVAVVITRCKPSDKNITPWKLSNCDWHIFTKRTRRIGCFFFLQKPTFFYLLLRAAMPALQSSAVSSSHRSPAHFCTMSHNNWSKSEGRKRKSAICDTCPDNGETWGGRLTLKNTLKEKKTELSNRLCSTIWNTDMKITTEY